ncbi:cupin-like domain-containing protein [Muriicola sp.]|uniref:cupin-like domain-containing protein n=1 Tax=Muriicola sp. TaxID=2020856 RepID=UPI003C76D2CF
MKLIEIPRITTLTKDQFLKDYLRPQKPVVIERYIEDWPAYSKWNFEYIKEIAGEKIVPLYDDRPVDHKEGFNQPHATMKMKDYIDLLLKEPTKYRIFLWNVMKEVPELQKDFNFPDFGIPIMKGLPMLFFGGTDSHTFMHYDIDLANIFHFHFAGKKECILFPQSENKYLYKIPHSLITHESIDFSRPNYEKWPALKFAVGYKTQLNHGEVLYMPEGYWHYMKYITPGFSMSLRSVARNPLHLSKALYNVLIMRHLDNGMRRIGGKQWIEWKNQKAIERTKKAIKSLA